ncbi:hypothetical protein TMatcc_003477 [Talaromyces marneffei ATCC 18224]|uniref:uncharacterized protein n=1 Tax=Talaromyces marneffei TaxID=37727 RepID=UPI0012A7B2A0|nr:uncharacterized protein EYB26_001481 [Talaromyces marneffei]QGA13830.1 hypothetical protein EYB26_001481 [Talaromyces marneffei]
MSPFWSLLVAETRVTITMPLPSPRLSFIKYASCYGVESNRFTCLSPAPSAPAASPSASQRGVCGDAGHDDRFLGP